jgi:transposase
MTKTGSQKSWKEARRFRAIELLDKGWTQQQVAEAFGVSQGTVSTWKIGYQKYGASALSIKLYPGHPSKLSTAQKEQLKLYLDEGAQAHGFEGNFWTQKRVSRLIWDKFSIELKPRSCGDLMYALEYKLKKPQLKSYDQNPDKVAVWKEETLPEIKKKQKNEMP